MVKEEYKQKIIDIISTYLPNTAIYLYGSRAREDHRAGSDIDIALDDKKEIDILTLAQIKEDIDEKTIIPLMIDLIDIQNSDKDFLKRIKKDWIPWKE